MITYLILGVAILVGLLLAGRWFIQANSAQIAVVVRWGALVLGAFFLIFILVSGRLSWLPALLFAALPWLHRLRAVATLRKNMTGSTPGQSSSVETRYLHMSLDHDTGVMDGEVIAGTLAGRKLRELDEEQLLALLRECNDDEQSCQLLGAYLDRMHGAEWRDQGGSTPAGVGNAMSVEEAREVLGIDAEASTKEVEEAYRKLMLKMHPDRGGSAWLAAKINRAREVLLQS